MSGLDRLRAGLHDQGLRLVRSWPRSPGHLLLHLAPVQPRTDPGSGSVDWLAGQWFADPAKALEVTRRTPGAHGLTPDHGGVVLQPAGADRRLVGLPTLLAGPGARLVAHRPERRAVVSHCLDGRAVFSKVVPGSRLAALAGSASWRPHGVRVPDVVAVDPAGTLTTAALPGVSLHALGRSAGPAAEAAAWRAAGAAVAALHRSPAPAQARRHDLAAEIEVTLGWLRHARDHGALDPERAEHLTALAVEAASRGDVEHTGAAATLHRDLHDGQLVVADDGRAALLDLDLVAVGDPAIDVANLLVHLRLRDEQAHLAGDRGSPRAPARASAFLAGYGRVPDPGRLQGLAVLAAARVAAVYAFRGPSSVRVPGDRPEAATDRPATDRPAAAGPAEDVGGVELGDRLLRVVTGGVC